MKMNKNVQGLIFDYGGTIDSNGKHWAEVLWEAYENNTVPVNKIQFREAYVYAERYLATHPIIEPEDNFLDLLQKKTSIQIKYLVENGVLSDNGKTSAFSFAISNQCYNFVRSILKDVKSVITDLAEFYPMVLVSNFYGNICTILDDFGMAHFFNEVIESAVVGVRKPDPAIFSLGIKALGINPQQVTVIGDSYSKDIVPAHFIGCQTIWLKGIGWDDEETVDTSFANNIITDFADLRNILLS